MNRTNNIKLGKACDKVILSELKKLKGFIGIDEIKDSQQNRYNINGLEKFYNDINSKLGVDYVLTMIINGKVQTLYIDTKGFNYSHRSNGKLTNGIVETIPLQIEKYYSGISRKGWANSPEHWTTNTIILINNHMYFIRYNKLVEYCNELEQIDTTVCITYDKRDNWNRYTGNYEKCILGNVEEMKAKGIITSIRAVTDTTEQIF